MKTLLLWLTFLIFVLTGAFVFGQEHTCVINGPEFLHQGSQEWCDTGFFAEVNTVASEELKTIESKLVFNTDGYASFVMMESDWLASLEQLQHRLAGVGVLSSLELYFGQARLITCQNKLAVVDADGVVLEGPSNECRNAD